MRPARVTSRALSSQAWARPGLALPRAHIRGEASSSRFLDPTVTQASKWASSTRYASNSSIPHHGFDKESVQDANPPMAGPSNLPASTDLLEVYRGMVAQGRLAWDEEQVRIVMKVGRDPLSSLTRKEWDDTRSSH